MKIFFDFEDIVVGIAIGIILISYSGRYDFSIPGSEILLLTLSPIAVIFTFLDIIHHLKDIGMNFMAWLSLTVHNLLNITILISLFSHLINYTIPYLTVFSQSFIQSNTFLFGLGIYFIVGFITHVIIEHLVLG